MRLALILLVAGFPFNSAIVFSQNVSDAPVSNPGLALATPELKPFQQFDWATYQEKSRSGFLRKLTTESFGYSLAPTGEGFEFRPRLTPGNYTEHGLECPRCIVRPGNDRSRYTLPPFGSTATLPFWQGRGKISGGFGGINAWKPDNTYIEPKRRGTSFNDAWLLQGAAGARVAVDHDRHLWLGAAGRYIENLGEGKKHWNSLGGSATFQFGH